MDLAIFRNPCIGGAKVVYSAANLICGGCGRKLLRCCSASRFAFAPALFVLIWSIPHAGIASEVLEQRFDGIVVPRQWVQVVPKVVEIVKSKSQTRTSPRFGDSSCFHSSNRIGINHVLGGWLQRLRSRHDLERLDDFILRDIGLSRGELRFGVSKQFRFN